MPDTNPGINSADTRTEDARAAAHLAARVSYGRLLALLASRTHDVAAAEDALADAFERALTTWPRDGVPANPDGWLLTVGRNRLRDHWKSAASTRTTTLDDGVAPPDAPAEDSMDPDRIGDRRLELILVCAHPAIDPVVRTPLMLNTVLGFTAAQIAQIFNLPTATMATRLTRAKHRINVNHIPFRIPDQTQLEDRLPDVLEAVYATYTIEWATTCRESRRVPPEALHLAELLAELVPHDPEVRGLAALVLLSTARRAGETPAATDPLVARAHEHLRSAHSMGRVGRFQLEASILAVHASAEVGSRPDHETLLSLHRALNRVAPTVGSRVAHAAVVAEVDGPSSGLAALDLLGPEAEGFQPAWATRAHLLARLGETAQAAAAFDRAISLTHDPAQREELIRRRAACRGGVDGTPQD